ncbi:hypothetical protein C0995_006955 [Termitomyces sp. Mi166|nr:hypothetical protein C0995_006955 [Termitomyces sp. Mi166\
MTAESLPSPMSKFKEYVSIVYQKYNGLHILGKTFIWLVVLFYISFGTRPRYYETTLLKIFSGIFVVIVTPGRIAQYLYDQAQLLAETRFGWLVLATSLVVVSFPPLLGHTTIVTLCGFAYGMQGFIIAAFATLVGASSVFVVLRFFFNQRLRTWSRRNQKWQALESVVSIEAVSLRQFATATICVFPRLLLHVFIGSRIAALSDGNQRGHMDRHTKTINGLLIAGGLILAICTSWYTLSSISCSVISLTRGFRLVYNMIKTHVRRLQESSHEVDELAADAIEDYGEDDPLLRSSPNL